jgi:membrane protein DedA with SNARE-associated domain
MTLDLLPTGVPVRLMRVVIMLGSLLGFYLAYKVGRYSQIAHAEEEKKRSSWKRIKKPFLWLLMTEYGS